MIQINRQYQSPAFDQRIKFLILHYTAQDFATSLKLLQDQVSSHYLIAEDGGIFQLVDENKRAWHAGVSNWENRSSLNDTSIGIEIVNLDGNLYPYPDQQIDALIPLCQQIITRHNIAPNHVLGHSDIAPARKTDPGSLFPWAKLHKHNIGALPDSADVLNLEKTINLPSALELQQSLAKYGYNINRTGTFDGQTQIVLDAFRRHFCPHLIGQTIDKSSYATLLALIKKYTS